MAAKSRETLVHCVQSNSSGVNGRGEGKEVGVVAPAPDPSALLPPTLLTPPTPPASAATGGGEVGVVGTGGAGSGHLKLTATILQA